MIKRILILPALAVLFLTSCNSGGCYETMDVKVYCSFYSLKDQKAVSLDSIAVRGVGLDSLYYSGKSVSELALELSPKTNITEYEIQARDISGNILTDTLCFYHTNQPWFQSMECGCMVFSTLDSIRTKGIIFQSDTILEHRIINQKAKHVIFKI